MSLELSESLTAAASLRLGTATGMNDVFPSRPRRFPALSAVCSQTSCYWCWGSGIWADYGRELCRRLEAILAHDF
jgi:hypothetical protein